MADAGRERSLQVHCARYLHRLCHRRGEQLDREVALWHPANFRQELVGEDRDVGLSDSGGGENVHDAFGRNRA